jgi:hypothetical protein
MEMKVVTAVAVYKGQIAAALVQKTVSLDM